MLHLPLQFELCGNTLACQLKDIQRESRKNRLALYFRKFASEFKLIIDTRKVSNNWSIRIASNEEINSLDWQGYNLKFELLFNFEF